ncbi:hypothetical protein PX554_13895 [Sphingomonas sp. H39-1-10]|uniref:hypothetical protein n=1 Tax=Sphingomonas pollutisoli TaxID=3030829 RepID=UPI0023B9DCBC|nr:hypothetical protein [Sphingomonas pollutisoli]MDF0489229.1 hypothetical protein [Sphingomonas pollutisoli]
MSGASVARQARLLTKKLAAELSGKKRGPDRRVIRHSVDENEPDAKPWRPIGDGTRDGALGWIDCMLEVARDFDDLERRKGGGRPLGGTGIVVLEVLLGRRGRKRVPIDFKTGELYPMIDTIAQAANLCRVTVVRALARLKAHGFLRWVRRSKKTDKEGEFAPQRVQTSNAYYFDPGALPKAVRIRLRQLFDRKLRAIERRNGAPPTGPTAPPKPSYSPLRAALEAFGDAVDLVEHGSLPSSPAIPA